MKPETFNQLVTEVKYVKVATEKITGTPTTTLFRPDGKTPAGLGTLLTAADAVYADFLAKDTDLSFARGAVEETQRIAHHACVDIYACAKSCYRKIGPALRAIRRLPTGDQTPAQTLFRMAKLLKVWAKLPPAPGGAVFQVREWTQANFEALHDDLKGKMTACVTCSADAQDAQDDLNIMGAELEALVTAALAQGRANYPEGTANRAYIDAIPTDPPAQKPGAVEFLVAESQGAGAVHLKFHSEHATTFQVWHKGPGEAQFAKVEEVLRPGRGQPGEYLKSGLPAGLHEYQTVGENSRGEGPASEVQTIAVAQAQAG